ncbi:MAG: glycosyltransferase family 1 protein [Candidatus Moraniibacteriota bacterium]
MKIGIDASRAFIKNRTGIEEYSFQVISHLKKELAGLEVFLYTRPKTGKLVKKLKIPAKWKVREIKWPRFWTQIGLSLEMILRPVDVLFIPAHTVPIVHPSGWLMKICNYFWGEKRKFKTVVTIHGLEYEFLPEAYSLWERIYMRTVIKKSCQWADKIISVSQNTKKDLVRLYKIPAHKIEVIYEGYFFEKSEQESNGRKKRILKKYQLENLKYLLFLGRIEERKNLIRIIKAFEILKEKYQIEHKLLLAGGLGYGYNKIVKYIEESFCKKDIYLSGFVEDREKREILKNADVFLFPTLYEGFGLPIIEAQSLGVPIVASNNSSIPEIIGTKIKPYLVNPQNPEEIADSVFRILNNKKVREKLVKPGLENVKRFSWDDCAAKIAEVLRG